MPENKAQINRDFPITMPVQVQPSQTSDNAFMKFKTSTFKPTKSDENLVQPAPARSDSDGSEYKLVSRSDNKRRKTKAQVKMLEDELEANPHWTNEDMIKIAKKAGLSKSQVYKWNWDQKKKLNILPSKVYVVQLSDDVIDSKSGQIVLRSPDELQKLQKLNIETLIQKPNVKK